MAKYFASFTANNGSTYLPKAWEYTNKNKAIKDVISSCMANHLNKQCNISKWRVDDESGVTIASGEIHDFGRCVRTI